MNRQTTDSNLRPNWFEENAFRTGRRELPCGDETGNCTVRLVVRFTDKELGYGARSSLTDLDRLSGWSRVFPVNRFGPYPLSSSVTKSTTERQSSRSGVRNIGTVGHTMGTSVVEFYDDISFLPLVRLVSLPTPDTLTANFHVFCFLFL